jgi:hypothetical protein
VQNDLEELFNLITLLKPGQLKTVGEFRKRFITRGDRLQPQNVEELQRLVGQVMNRNRRSTAGIAFTQRHAYTVRVAPTPDEVELRTVVSEATTTTHHSRQFWKIQDPFKSKVKLNKEYLPIRFHDDIFRESFILLSLS